MERYQLSADFAEKQLQVLQRKYGGPDHAGRAALTIQRAFRRYSMAKKFADLTAQAKTEKRISRRLEYRTSTPPAAVASASAANKTSSSSTAVVQPGHTLHFHVHGQQHHYQHHHHSNHQCLHRQQQHQQRSRNTSTPSIRALHESSTSSPNLVHQYGQQMMSTAVAVSEGAGTSPGSGGSSTIVHSSSAEGDSSNSCPDIQSFPLDETSVYAHSQFLLKQSSTTVLTRSGSLRRDESPGPAPSSSSAATAQGNNSLSHVRKTSYPLLQQQQPAIPKRTVSARMPSSSSNGNASNNNNNNNHSGNNSPLTRHSSSKAFSYPQQQDVADGRHASRQAHVVTGQGSVSAYGSGGSPSTAAYSVNEVIRKRHYRTGLNIFNKKPEKGISYLIKRGFLENSPQAVARFLITRKGLSKQMIGEYLGNLSIPFNMASLNCFAMEMDFSGMQIDTALRKFQTYFRMPGEAQKIERLMEVFSSRYCQCNPDVVSKLSSTDTTFILAFAIILLNTDLHTPSLKQEKRMKLEDFVRNLRGIDEGKDLDQEMLAGIYDRIRNQEFRPGSDHVTQVMKVQQTIVSKCPNLAIPHRRLVCYCRLYEVPDPYKKERPGIHQREVFLFNDILVITKIHSRKKNTVTYAFRQSYLLAGMQVNLFDTQFYPFGIQVAQKWDRKIVLMLNARNEHDRSKFVEDLKESIAEMDELEQLRLESELERQRVGGAVSAGGDNRDSGINEGSQVVAVGTTDTMPLGASCSPEKTSAGTPQLRSQHQPHHHTSSNGVVLRRSAINNSLLDLSDATAEKLTRRGSVGSLDSGMSVSFQSNSVAGSYCIGNGTAAGAMNSNGTPRTGQEQHKDHHYRNNHSHHNRQRKK